MKFWTTFRLRLAAALAVLAAIGVAFALLPWRIGDGPMRAEAEKRLRQALNAPDASFGQMSLILLPTPRLRIGDIRFARADGSLSGAIEVAKVSLRIAPLLRGIPKPSGATLQKPDLVARLPDAAADPAPAANALLNPITRYFAEHGSFAGLSELDIDKGRLTFVTDSGLRQAVSDVNLRASLPGRTRPLKFVASGRHGGQDIRASFSGASPAALASGEIEPLSFAVQSQRFSYEFTGTGSLVRGLSAKGQLAARLTVADSPAGPALAVLGVGPPMATVRATLDIGARGTTFTDLSVVSGPYRLDGVGAMRHDGQRWHANATLATARIDMTFLRDLAASAHGPTGGWSTTPFAADPLFAANLDLRLSADRVTIGSQQISQAALAVITRAGRIEVNLGDGVFEGGRAKARLAATRSADGFDVRASGSLFGSDLGAAMVDAGWPRRVSGLANAEFEFESNGVSAAELAARLDGRLSAAFRSGELLGIDLHRLATRRTGRPEALLAESLGGGTAFESATVSTRIARGLAGPVEGYMQANRLVGTLGGTVDLPGFEVSLFGSVIQVSSEPAQTDPLPVLDFSIAGPLAAPRTTPNVTNLLKRS